jgi:hypothetical protein
VASRQDIGIAGGVGAAAGKARRARRLFALVLLLAASPIGPMRGAAQAPTAAAPPPAEAQPKPAARIEGFREAHFGMTEAELRRAIRKDFPQAVGRLRVAIHPTEKTTILSLTASNLLPDTGAARISYILGYKSKRLVQVNILWESDGKSAARDEAVVATANQLRDYFAAQNFRSDSIVRNQKLADGAILVFRASDAEGSMVALVLSGAAAAARHGKAPPPLILELSYIKDSAHPDIYQIPKGQF